MRILSIDAWRDGNGWTWNNWHNVGDTENDTVNLDSPRAVFQYLRERGYLSDYSKGRVALDDDGYNVVVIDRNTREPIFAIEYGPYH